MGGPYINPGNYRYGVSDYNQPSPPCYEMISHHRTTTYAQNPIGQIRDDGVPYTAYLEDQTNYCLTCGRCNRIVRNALMTSLVNISTELTKVLTIKLYGTSSDKDKTINMKLGNKYCVSFVTESGVQTVTGVLKEVSSNVPEETIKYIGNYGTVPSTAYIGMDCSTAGNSNKLLIYIASIRYIEEVWDDNEDKYASLTQDERIRAMVEELSTTISSISTYVDAKMAALEETTEEESTAVEDNSKPADYRRPPRRRYEVDRPLIIGPVPLNPKFRCPADGTIINGSGSNSNTNGNSSNNNADDVDLEALVSALEDVKSVMNSFIAAYDLEHYQEEKCNCPCNKDEDENKDDCCGNHHHYDPYNPKNDIGIPIVPEVPYNAREKDLFLVEAETGVNLGSLTGDGDDDNGEPEPTDLDDVDDDI